MNYERKKKEADRMRDASWSFNKFQPLLDLLSNYIEPHIMDRGIDYYHNGQVEDLSVGEISGKLD
jgi:uncharacterized Zn finger protein